MGRVGAASTRGSSVRRERGDGDGESELLELVVGEGDGEGEGVGVGEGDGEGEGVGEGDGEGEGVGDGEGEGVGDGDGEGEGVGDGEGEGVGVGEGDGEGEGVGDGEGEGVDGSGGGLIPKPPAPPSVSVCAVMKGDRTERWTTKDTAATTMMIQITLRIPVEAETLSFSIESFHHTIFSSDCRPVAVAHTLQS